MAITVVSLGSIADTAGNSAFGVNLARAPNDNELVLVAVAVTDVAGTPAQPTGVASDSLKFSLVTGSSITALPTTAGSQIGNLSVWRCMRATGADGSRITATFSNAATGCSLLVAGISGVSTSGVSGINAVSVSSTSAADGTTGLTVWTPSAISTADGWIAFTQGNVANPQTAQNGWTQLASHATSYATPTVGVGTSAYTTVSSANSCLFTFGSGINHSAIVVGLVADNPAIVGGTVIDTWQLRRLYEGYHG